MKGKTYDSTENGSWVTSWQRVGGQEEHCVRVLSRNGNCSGLEIAVGEHAARLDRKVGPVVVRPRRVSLPKHGLDLVAYDKREMLRRTANVCCSAPSMAPLMASTIGTPVSFALDPDCVWLYAASVKLCAVPVAPSPSELQ